jgi:hypothetical protein
MKFDYDDMYLLIYESHLVDIKQVGTKKILT